MTPVFENTAAVILAAGKGTRMNSSLPKVLHRVCGTPMVGRVIRSLKAVGLSKFCAVIGGETDLLGDYLTSIAPITLTSQLHRLGTGEAVACAGYGLTDTKVPGYASGGHLSGPKISCQNVLVCAGDTPALDPNVIADFLEYCHTQKSKIAVLAMNHPNPKGYGRIVCDDSGAFHGIVEEKDASDEQRKITLCNSGVIFGDKDILFELLSKISPNNAQGEFYLTDCFAEARKAGLSPSVYVTENYRSFDGVNDRVQLASLENAILEQFRNQLMSKGVTIRLPQSLYIEDTVSIERDCEIGAHCTLLGKTHVSEGCVIGSHSILQDATIAPGTHVPPGSIILSS